VRNLKLLVANALKRSYNGGRETHLASAKTAHWLGYQSPFYAFLPAGYQKERNSQMKKKKFVIGLASLALMLGAAGVVGGSYSHFGGDAVMTRAADDNTSETVTINFGSSTGYWKINAATSTFKDSKTTWTATTVGTTKFSCGAGYTQIGNSSSPATSFTLSCGEMPKGFLVTSVSAVLKGGSSYTKGDVAIKVGDTSVGSGTINGNSANVTVSSAGSVSGSTITITVTNISKSFQLISLSYKVVDTNVSVAVTDGADINLIKGAAEATYPLTLTNRPDGSTLEVAVVDSTVATAIIDGTNLIVTPVGLGSTSYTVNLVNDGETIASCTGVINVSVAINKVTITASFNDGDTLNINKTYNLTATVDPSDASQDVKWSISDSAAATITDDGVLTIVKKTSDDAVTVTATSAADATKTTTISFYVNNTFAIADLVSQDGENYPDGLSEGCEVATSGVVTAIEGTSVYIQSGDAAILLYTYGTELSALKIGDYVNAAGSLKIYNGVTELTSPSATVDTTKSETITPLEGKVSDMISKNTNRLMTVKDAKYNDSTDKTITGSKDISVSFKLADKETDLIVYIKKAEIENAAKNGAFRVGISYNITGIFVNYKNSTKQIYIDQGCSFTPVDKDKLDAFVADYITKYSGEAKEGETCKSKCENAKAAYDALSDNAKALFATADYAEAKKIYDYWNEHQNDSSSVGFASSNSANWTAIGAIAVGLLVAGAATYMFVKSRKRKEND
jgi:hypothetical protein